MKKFVSGFLLLTLTLNTCQTLAMQKFNEQASPKKVALEQVTLEEIELEEANFENIIQTRTGTEILPKLYTDDGSIPEDVIKHVLLQHCDCKTLQNFNNTSKKFREFVEDFVIKGDLTDIENIIKKRADYCFLTKNKEYQIKTKMLLELIEKLSTTIKSRFEKNEYDSFPLLLTEKYGNTKIRFLNKNNYAEKFDPNKLFRENNYEREIMELDISNQEKCKTLKRILKDPLTISISVACLIISIILCTAIGSISGFVAAYLVECDPHNYSYPRDIC